MFIYLNLTDEWITKSTIASSDSLTNFILIKRDWSNGITPLIHFYQGNYLRLGERFRHAAHVWGRDTTSSVQMQLFLWDSEKKMNLFPDTILQVHTVFPESFEHLRPQSACQKAEKLYKTCLHYVRAAKVNLNMPSKHTTACFYLTFKAFQFCFNQENNFN